MSKSKWSMLPGGEWEDARAARRWFRSECERLQWSTRDVEKAFAATAYLSDLYVGPGGGDLFRRPTEARQRKFLAGGEEIPDWMYWIPLVITHADIRAGQVRIFEAADWALANVPHHRDNRDVE